MTKPTSCRPAVPAILSVRRSATGYKTPVFVLHRRFRNKKCLPCRDFGGNSHALYCVCTRVCVYHIMHNKRACHQHKERNIHQHHSTPPPSPPSPCLSSCLSSRVVSIGRKDASTCSRKNAYNKFLTEKSDYFDTYTHSSFPARDTSVYYMRPRGTGTAR